jgi:toxin YhaV
MVSNESRILFHAAFEHVLDELVAVVAKERERDPEHYKKSPRARLLAAIYKALKDEIPADPQHARYYQGEASGYAYRHWKRAKPAGEYRLFFKCVKESDESNEGKVIIYVWLNGEMSLSKYQRHMDEYMAFRKSKK